MGAEAGFRPTGAVGITIDRPVKWVGNLVR
jgi:hypothetical protein